MNIKAIIALLLAPVMALAQVAHFTPGERIALGEQGIRYSAPAYDADAIAYFARAGVTDASAKQQISDFVRGLKAQGLWANFVFWPLRSSQNAGTGTTAYSLGGLGTYNGTLVNGPTWGASGLTFGTDDYIATSLSVATNTGNWSCGLVLQASAVVSNSTFISFSSEGKTPLYSASTGASVAQVYLGNTTRAVSASIDWTTAYRSLMVTKSSTTMTGYVNGANGAGGSITTGGTDSMTFRPGGGGGNSCNAMTSPIVFYTTDVLSAGQTATLHGIMRDTICAGMGLP